MALRGGSGLTVGKLTSIPLDSKIRDLTVKRSLESNETARLTDAIAVAPVFPVKQAAPTDSPDEAEFQELP
jgi:hypothetical protein